MVKRQGASSSDSMEGWILEQIHNIPDGTEIILELEFIESQITAH
ncbi:MULTISPECIES: hypothetical protein [unclassified Anabaena]